MPFGYHQKNFYQQKKTLLLKHYILEGTYPGIPLYFVQKQVGELEKERSSMVIEDEESLKDYYDLLQQYKTLKRDVRDIVLSPKYVLPFLQSGRLVRVQYITDEQPTFSIDENVTWGIIINFEKVKTHDEGIYTPLGYFFSSVHGVEGGSLKFFGSGIP